jgi:transposase
MGREVLLANPLQTKAIAYARVQDDKVDARTLTHLLRTDLLPTCWIPNKEERSIRDMLRIRLSLLVMRTRFKNIIWAILAKFNINIAGSLWNKNGRDSLETIITQSEHDDLARLVLPPPYGEAIRQALLHIDYLTEQIDYWEKKIHGLVVISPDARRLITAPGIGELSALTILYESGPIERFPTAKHYASYAGLVPRTLSSAGKYWSGHLCKQANMYLKRIYIEVAIGSLKARAMDGRLRSFYYRVLKRKGNHVAKVALARKMAAIVYHMLKRKIDYEICMARNKLAG